MKLVVKGVCAVVVVGAVGGAILALRTPEPACGCLSEVVGYVRTLATSQQAKLLEQGKFATTIAALDTTIPEQTEKNRYSMDTQPDRVIIYGQSRRPNHKGYVAGVFKITQPDGPTTAVLHCIAETLGTHKPTAPIDAQTCGAGTTKLGD